VAFSKNLLNEHEDLVLDLRPHWIYMFTPTISLVGSVLVGMVVWSKDAPDVLNVPVGVGILVVLGWFGWRYAKWVTTNFVVTSDRVIWREGVLAKKGTEIPLERINTVFFNQSIFERMIGAGDLGIESAGERGMETFEDVRKPSNVQNEIYRQMEAHTQRTYGGVQAVNQATQAATAAAASAASASAEKSIPEQLRALDELRQNGVLTQAEFDAKKAQLLERM